MISTLQQLRETTVDGENGYKTAAEDCTDANLKQTFLDLSLQRARFSSELKDLLKKSGSDVAESGSLAGLVHRGWINVKAAVVKREDVAVLEECERGEDSAVKQYQEALATNHLGEALAIVQKQYDHIQRAHSLVKNLRDKIGAPAVAG